MAFRAHFLNVGCADCTIFEMQNGLAVIDCGYRRFTNGISKPTNIAEYIRSLARNKIDLLIISHPHHDHYLAMEELIGKVNVSEFWGSPYQRRRDDNSLALEEWKEYCNLKERLVPNPNRRFTCSKGVQKVLSNCTYVILGPHEEINTVETRECHDASLVIWVSAPSNKFVICGDASDSELEQIKKDWDLSGCTILRASHHGSKNGASLEFIKSVSPRDTIISTKSGIFESVPSDVALRRYKENSQKVFRTDADGTCTAPITP